MAPQKWFWQNANFDFLIVSKYFLRNLKKKRKSVNLIKISNFNFKFLDIDPCIFVQLVFTTYIWLNLCSKFSFYYSRPFSSLNKGWYTNYVEKILKIFNPLPLVDKHRHLVMPPQARLICEKFWFEPGQPKKLLSQKELSCKNFSFKNFWK